jgi:phenylacetate-CoA ligase
MTTRASALPLQVQLAKMEWWTPDRILGFQLREVTALVDHAYRTVDFYRTRLETAGLLPGKPVTLEQWRKLPLLTRQDIQRAGKDLHSTAVPVGHGKVTAATTSGSTGSPVTVLGTEFSSQLSGAFALRNHLWHKRDFSQKIAWIGKLPNAQTVRKTGTTQTRWGDTVIYPFETGPSALLDVSVPIAQQVEWLAAERPAYLVTYPSILAAILEIHEARGLSQPGLLEVMTMGEVLEEEVRAACRRVWNIPVVDAYSAQEVGVIALQCPGRDHYHIQSESLLLEIIDAQGNPVNPGEIGKVVATPLHNFAMPLLRYEIGDYAELGAPCPCGRGLPVLRQVLGRTRNMLVTPDGNRYWPSLGSRTLREIAPIIQHQFVQTDIETIEARLFTERPLAEAEERELIEHIRSRLPYPFKIELRFVDAISRTAGAKYEYFRSELGDGGAGPKMRQG